MASVPAVSAASIMKVADPQVREVLRAMADGIAIRNGDVGNGDHAFLTMADLRGDRTKAAQLVRAIGGPLADAITETAPGQPLADLADELRDSILKSPAWLAMFTRLQEIDAPDTVPGSFTNMLLKEARERATGIYRAETKITETNEQLASTREVLTAKIGENVAAIAEERTARVTQGESLATQISALAASTGRSLAGIEQNLKVHTNNDNALAQAINTIWARVGTNQALVQSGTTVVVNPVGSAATKFDQLQATASSALGTANSASKDVAILRVDQSVTADKVAGLSGKWGVKIDLNGYVSGVALNSGVTTGGKAESSFIVLADKFAIGAPGKRDAVPFAIDARTGLVAIDGSLVATDTISGAALRATSISRDKLALKVIGGAQIDDLAVSTLKIGNNAVTVPLQMGGGGGSFPKGSVRRVGQISATFADYVDVIAVVTWQAAGADEGSNSSVFLDVDGWTYASTSVSNIKEYSISHCFTGRASLNPGRHTFSVSFGNDWGNSHWVMGNWSVVLLGVMK